MPTTYQERTQATESTTATPWKIATVALAISTAVLGIQSLGGKSNAPDMNMSGTTHGAHFDHGFINMMIPHHQQAIDEAKVALTKAQHPELKQLAQNIIKSQQAEIDQMKQWRKDWYGE